MKFTKLSLLKNLIIIIQQQKKKKINRKTNVSFKKTLIDFSAHTNAKTKREYPPLLTNKSKI